MKIFYTFSILLLFTACASDPIVSGDILPSPESTPTALIPTPVVSMTPSTKPSASASAPVFLLEEESTPSPIPSPLATPTPSPTATPPIEGPHVVALVAANNVNTLDPSDLRFSLRFSEPMDPESIKNALSLHVHQDAMLHLQVSSRKLFETLASLPRPVSPAQPMTDKPRLLNSHDFNLTWNESQDLFTWTARRASLALPNDADPGVAPAYALSFYSGGQAHTLRTQSGKTVAQNWFASSTGAQDYVRIKLQANTKRFELSSIQAHGGGLVAHFTTPLAKVTPWGVLSAAHPQLNDNVQRSPLHASNYRVSLYHKYSFARYATLVAEFNWGDLTHNAAGDEISGAGTVEWFSQDNQVWSATTPQTFDAVSAVRLVPPAEHPDLLLYSSSDPNSSTYLTLEVLSDIYDAESQRLRSPAKRWASNEVVASKKKS